MFSPTSEQFALETKETKLCRICGEVKPLVDFAFRERCRKYAEAFCLLCGKEQEYQRKYGIGIVDYGIMLEQQNGKCAICGTTDPGKSRKYFCIDHNHSKDKDSVRGLLCDDCNRGLGAFHDNADHLVAAADYLVRDSQ